MGVWKFQVENLVRLLPNLGKSYRRVKKTWKIHFDCTSVKRHFETIFYIAI
jgi:hypothetical protein